MTEPNQNWTVVIYAAPTDAGPWTEIARGKFMEPVIYWGNYKFVRYSLVPPLKELN